MGVAQAGLVFRSKVPLRDMGALVSKLCGGQAVPIEQPLQSKFDIRNPSDVMVLVYGDVYFICNIDIAWDLLEDPVRDVTQRHCVLGTPEWLMAFCHYDSGDSYGYAFIERGARTRSRLQTSGEPELIEHGTPKDFEARWLSADFYLEEDDCPVEEWRKIYFQGNREIQVSEGDLTRRMLQEALLLHFGVCPWEDERTPASYCFRLSVSKKPWWQLW